MQKEASGDGSAQKPVLTVKNVSYYLRIEAGAGRCELSTCFPGRVTALLGPNGAGKTTLFSLITRLFDAPTGRIEICGRSAGRLGRMALGPLGIVFQQPTLDLDLTVRQNLALFRGAARPQAQGRRRAHDARADRARHGRARQGARARV